MTSELTHLHVSAHVRVLVRSKLEIWVQEAKTVHTRIVWAELASAILMTNHVAGCASVCRVLVSAYVIVWCTPHICHTADFSVWAIRCQSRGTMSRRGNVSHGRRWRAGGAGGSCSRSGRDTGGCSIKQICTRTRRRRFLSLIWRVQAIINFRGGRIGAPTTLWVRSFSLDCI